MAIPLQIQNTGPDTPVHPAIIDLVHAFPLATIVSGGGEASLATPLPLIGEFDADGRLVSFLGHFSRANPQVQALMEDGGATILFAGPNGYISPQHVANPAWAPTWNYALARFRCTLRFLPEENDPALRQLTETMERASGGTWTVEMLGPRYDAMRAHIIAFRASILRHDASFKLGQDEKDHDFTTIIAGLGDTPLARWMQKAREPGGA